jgi:hypothetical protein
MWLCKDWFFVFNSEEIHKLLSPCCRLSFVIISFTISMSHMFILEFWCSLLAFYHLTYLDSRLWDLSIFNFWKPHLFYLLPESFIIKFLSFDDHHQFSFFFILIFCFLHNHFCLKVESTSIVYHLRAYASKLDDWSLFCLNVQPPWSLCKFPKISNSSQSILCFHYLKMRLVHLFHQNIVLLFFLMGDYQWQCLITLVRTYLDKMLRIKGNYTIGQRSFRMFGHFACHGLNPCSMRRV